MPEQREEGALVRTSSCQILPQSLHKAKKRTSKCWHLFKDKNVLYSANTKTA